MISLPVPEPPRPTAFLAMLTVSVMAHLLVAGWYALRAPDTTINLPAPTLQVRVLAAEKVASIQLQSTSRQVPPAVDPAPVPEFPKPAQKLRAPPATRIKHAAQTPPIVEETRTPHPEEVLPLDKPTTAAAAFEVPDYVPPSSDTAYLNNPEPQYPAAALRRNIEGTVWLHVDVDEQGRPLEVLVKQSAGFKPLDIAALKAVRRWTFIPARRHGQAVRASVEFPVRFEIREGLRESS